MVEYVERFQPEIHLQTFTHRECSPQGGVYVPGRRTVKPDRWPRIANGSRRRVLKRLGIEPTTDRRFIDMRFGNDVWTESGNTGQAGNAGCDTQRTSTAKRVDARESPTAEDLLRQ